MSDKEANLLSDKREKILKMIVKNNLTLTKGLLLFLRRLKDLKILLSIATGRDENMLSLSLTDLKLKNTFFISLQLKMLFLVNQIQRYN